MYRPRKARIYKDCNLYISKKLAECGLTKKNLAVAVGCHEGVMDTKCRDIRSMTLRDMIIVSGVLGVSVEVFVAAIVRNMSPTIVDGMGLADIVAAKVRAELGEG